MVEWIQAGVTVASALTAVIVFVWKGGGFVNKLVTRFDGLERRMDKFEQGMDKFEQRMDKFEVRMDKFETRLDRLEREVNKIRIRLIKK